jgi:hypothetical protein
MNEEMKKLIHLNQRMALLIGVMSVRMAPISETSPYSDIQWATWIGNAINNLFYLDKPFPPMPKEGCSIKHD